MRHTLRRLLAAVFAIACLGGGGSAKAELIDRGGGLIYDTVLNVTWLKDANYAFTTGYQTTYTNGQMTWSEAMTWASNLVYYDSVRGVSWDDWRLPDNNPLNGSTYLMAVSTGGDTDDGYNISAPGTLYAGSTAKELPYMFYNTLGNVGRCPVGGGFAACLGTEATLALPTNTGPFINLYHWSYWTNSNSPVAFAADAWGFKFGGPERGSFGSFNGAGASAAWAVRDGDVALVPESSTWAMVVAGLLIVAGGVKSRRRSLSAGD